MFNNSSWLTLVYEVKSLHEQQKQNRTSKKKKITENVHSVFMSNCTTVKELYKRELNQMHIARCERNGQINSIAERRIQSWIMLAQLSHIYTFGIVVRIRLSECENCMRPVPKLSKLYKMYNTMKKLQLTTYFRYK